jgi:hypothetical protein
MTKRRIPKVALTAEQLKVRRYFSADEIEQVYNIPTNFLRDLRSGLREGPQFPYKKIGYRSFLYGPVEEIELWIAAHPGGRQTMIPVQQSTTKTRRGRTAA